MSGRVRVLLWHRTPAQGDEAVLSAYHVISRRLRGTPGLLANELLRDPIAPDRYVVISEWESLEAFRTWEQGSQHKGTTEPLRPFRDLEQSFEILEVVASY